MTTATQQQKDPIESIVRVVESPNLKAQIMRALPKQLDVERFMRLCMTVIRKTPAIQRCEPLSIVSSVVEASQLGLELDPVLGHGYLIPRKSKKLSEQYGRQVTLCTFMPGYKGFIHLMRNSGLVTNVNAELRLEGEDFHVDLGTQRALIHVPNYELNRTDEKLWLGAYCVVYFRDWNQPDFEYLPKSEINERRNRSDAKDSGPWVSDTDAMWKKTTIRAIAKRMPLSPQNRELIRTAALDELRENEEYREREPIAPAFELPQETLTVSGGDPEPAAEPEKKEEKGATVRRKSAGKKLEPDGNNPAVPKSQMPKGEMPELVTEGQVKNLVRYATEEKGMSRGDLINLLGAFGYETPESIQKKDYTAIWTEVGNRKPAKK